MTKEEVLNKFTYQSSHKLEIKKYELIGTKAKELALLIHDSCPESLEKELAFIRLQEVFAYVCESIQKNICIFPLIYNDTKTNTEVIFYCRIINITDVGILPQDVYSYFLDDIIVNWSNITDDEGKELECTKKNKMRLYKEHPELVDNFLIPQYQKLIKERNN